VRTDRDVLIGQDGNDHLFTDQLVNVSSLTSFENFGGTIGTGAPGDFLTGGINDDVLRGGADDLDAEERIAGHMISL
jgi:Ca2+-binding RTX toxin-like protein